MGAGGVYRGEGGFGWIWILCEALAERSCISKGPEARLLALLGGGGSRTGVSKSPRGTSDRKMSDRKMGPSPREPAGGFPARFRPAISKRSSWLHRETNSARARAREKPYLLQIVKTAPRLWLAGKGSMDGGTGFPPKTVFLVCPKGYGSSSGCQKDAVFHRASQGKGQGVACLSVQARNELGGLKSAINAFNPLSRPLIQ